MNSKHLHKNFRITLYLPNFSSELSTIKWNMNFFYYKNAAQEIKLLTFINNFHIGLTWNTLLERVKYNTAAEYKLLTEDLHNIINSVVKYVYV
jgi:hypothetical protein